MIKTLVLDVDGILTDGSFQYDLSGIKVFKTFGPDDSDALKLISSKVDIVFVSADLRGFPISQARVNHLGYKLYHVPSTTRLEWISSRYNLNEVCYFGDGFYDGAILSACFYGVSTVSSSPLAKASANYITSCPGGSRAVAEGILHLTCRFFPDLYHQYLKRNQYIHEGSILYQPGTMNLEPLVRKYIEAFNHSDLNLFHSLLDPECILTDFTSGIQLKGVDSIYSFSQQLVCQSGISVQIQHIATNPNLTAFCLLQVAQIGNSESLPQVLDMLSFNSGGLIYDISAYELKVSNS